jgi:hypothetical protein
MTIGKVHKQAVGGGYGAQPVGHEAKAPKGGKVAEEQQPVLPGGAKYNADGFEGAKHCKGGHAAEGKKNGGHKKDPGQALPPGGVTPPGQGAYPIPPIGGTPPAGGTPPVGGTPPAQGGYPTPPTGGTPPAGETPPTQGTPPVGQPAEGTPEQTLKTLQEIAGTIEKLIEALGGQPPEQQAPGTPPGNTGIVPPGAVQGPQLAQAA